MTPTERGGATGSDGEATSNTDMRRERDALGELAVPADALYGIHTMRALRHLSFSSRPLGGYGSLVRALGHIKGAAARVNAAAGVLDPRLSEAIQAAARRMTEGELCDALPVDVLGGGGSIGVHMNVNEVLANVANEILGGKRGLYDPIDPKRHVGASQSTADVCHTAARLAVFEQGSELNDSLDPIIQVLQEKQRELASLPTLARTCLQDAMATTLGTLFGGYAAQIERRRNSLKAAVFQMNRVSIGGTVIGSGEGAPAIYRARIVEALGQAAGRALVRREPLPDAMQSSDDLRAVSAELAMLAETLIKICQDLRLLASGPHAGFGELVLPHVLEGSSFFGNKRNPVIPETVIQCSIQVLACDRAVQAACEHAELYLNIFDGLAAVNILDALGMLTRALPHLREDCLQGLEANQARCRELSALAAKGP